MSIDSKSFIFSDEKFALLVDQNLWQIDSALLSTLDIYTIAGKSDCNG